jgi:hypothetical protein
MEYVEAVLSLALTAIATISHNVLPVPVGSLWSTLHVSYALTPNARYAMVMFAQLAFLVSGPTKEDSVLLDVKFPVRLAPTTGPLPASPAIREHIFLQENAF